MVNSKKSKKQKKPLTEYYTSYILPSARTFYLLWKGTQMKRLIVFLLCIVPLVVFEFGCAGLGNIQSSSGMSGIDVLYANGALIQFNNMTAAYNTRKERLAQFSQASSQTSLNMGEETHLRQEYDEAYAWLTDAAREYNDFIRNNEKGAIMSGYPGHLEVESKDPLLPKGSQLRDWYRQKIEYCRTTNNPTAVSQYNAAVRKHPRLVRAMGLPSRI